MSSVLRTRTLYTGAKKCVGFGHNRNMSLQAQSLLVWMGRIKKQDRASISYMESESATQEVEQEVESSAADQTSRLFHVTPLSKYLAMALFVILPFVGGWIGYQFAPEKVVEVEQVIEFGNINSSESVNDAGSGASEEYVTESGNLDTVGDAEGGDGFVARGIEQWVPVTIGGQVYDETNGQYDAEKARSVLSYSTSTFMINGQPAYSVSNGNFKYFPAGGSHFLKLADQIYGMRMVGLGASELIEIPLADADNFQSIRNGYASDGENIFYVTEENPLNLDVTQSEFIELEISEAPLVVDGNNVYFRGRHLKNLDYEQMQIGMHDNDNWHE